MNSRTLAALAVVVAVPALAVVVANWIGFAAFQAASERAGRPPHSRKGLDR